MVALDLLSLNRRSMAAAKPRSKAATFGWCQGDAADPVRRIDMPIHPGDIDHLATEAARAAIGVRYFQEVKSRCSRQHWKSASVNVGKSCRHAFRNAARAALKVRAVPF
jgi:hypothetical protein